MNLEQVYTFMDGERLAVLATATAGGQPEAALMGIAVTRELEIVFDTVKTSRKYPNLKSNPRVALALGAPPRLLSSMKETRTSWRARNWRNTKRLTLQNSPTGRSARTGRGSLIL